MRTEVKAGIVIGLVFIAAGILFLSSQKGQPKANDPNQFPANTASGQSGPPTAAAPGGRVAPSDGSSRLPLTEPPPGVAVGLGGTPTPGPLDLVPRVGDLPPRVQPPVIVPTPETSPTVAGGTTDAGGARSTTTPPTVTPTPGVATGTGTGPDTGRVVVPPRPEPVAPVTGTGTGTTGTGTDRGTGTAGGTGTTGGSGPTIVPPSDVTTGGGTSGAAGQPTTYTVQEGDYLSTIAHDVYGDVRYWPAIEKANPGIDPDHILPGQKLNLPPREAVVGPAGRTTPAPGATGTTGGTTVRPPTGTGTPPPGATGRTSPTETGTRPPTGTDTTPTGGRGTSGTSSGTGTPPAGGATAGASTYTVREGDYLATIARDKYGDERYWRLIVDANPGINPDNIHPGQVLKLPPKPASSGASSRASEPGLTAVHPAGGTGTSGSSTSAPGAGTGRAGSSSTGTAGRTPAPSGIAPAGAPATYVVKRGDTLLLIAEIQLGDRARWREIYELNKSKLPSPNNVPVGTELKLPPRRAATSTPARGGTGR